MSLRWPDLSAQRAVVGAGRGALRRAAWAGSAGAARVGLVTSSPQARGSLRHAAWSSGAPSSGVSSAGGPGRCAAPHQPDHRRSSSRWRCGRLRLLGGRCAAPATRTRWIAGCCCRRHSSSGWASSAPSPYRLARGLLAAVTPPPRGSGGGTAAEALGLARRIGSAAGIGTSPTSGAEVSYAAAPSIELHGTRGPVSPPMGLWQRSVTGTGMASFRTSHGAAAAVPAAVARAQRLARGAGDDRIPARCCCSTASPRRCTALQIRRARIAARRAAALRYGPGHRAGHSRSTAPHIPPKRGAGDPRRRRAGAPTAVSARRSSGGA